MKEGAESPLFSPRHPNEAEARETLLQVVRSTPSSFGLDRTRWRLDDLREACPWLHLSWAGSLHRLLDRMGIGWKRGREHVHSPDPDYFPKLRFLYERLEEAQMSGGETRVVFLDELTYYRHPSLANAYEGKGALQPHAHRGHGSNTTTRVIGGLEALSGRVHFWQGAKTGVSQFVSFYQKLCESDTKVRRWWVAQDNWPLHFHPDLLVALEPQERPFSFRPCPHWKTMPREELREKWKEMKLPVQILPLPTYAPWTNPIEKLWRWSKQDVLHLHRHSEELPLLRERFTAFLQRFAEGSQELLRYVGLSDPLKLYRNAQNHLPALPPCP